MSINVRVTARKNEGDKSLLRRFNKAVASNGVLGAARRKRWFVSKAETRRLDKKRAIRRLERRRRKKQ